MLHFYYKLQFPRLTSCYPVAFTDNR